MPNYVALLRGVNVGGRSTLAMADLRRVVEDLGYDDVRTYINSGNVLFGSPKRHRDVIAAEIRSALGDFTGRDVAVVVRSKTDLEHVTGYNPFPGADPKQLHVAFLSSAPEPDQAAAMMALFDDHPERAELRGGEVYVDFVNGAGRTKVDFKRVDAAGSVESTSRNWRTVNTLLQKLDE